MSNHKCMKCDKIFKRKGHLNDHLNKKNSCQQEIMEKTEIQDPIGAIPPKTTKTHQIIVEPNIVEQVAEPAPVINNACYYCNKSFVRKDVMNKHMKFSCKVLKQQNKGKQEIFEKLELLELKNQSIVNKNQYLEDEIRILKDEIKSMQPNNMINNNNINNGIINNTNIIMVAHGQEDISKICDKLLVGACKRGYNSVPQLVESIHFNPNFPEFHNVYIPDLKNKHAMVYDKDMWVLKNKDEVVNDMYHTKKDMIIDNMEKNGKYLNNGQQKTLQRWLKSDENKDNDIDDKKSIEHVFDSLKLLLYNFKHIPIETKEKLVSQQKQQLLLGI